MKKIKLGIIGLSEGNGHPYSWSAIINTYNPTMMADCPFPVIPQYLEKEPFPEAAIQHAEITHIWTQDLTLSHHIASATYIPHVVEQMEEMIPYIDGVLLARDDAHHHVAMAKPFLNAGIPIYIDKPLALTCSDVELLFSMQQYPGQLFSCSAFQYARELENHNINVNNLTHIEAYISNDWDKYAIHLIEPIVKIIGHDHRIEEIKISSSKTQKTATYLLSNGLTILIKTYQKQRVKPTINFFSADGVKCILFEDTFFAFKTALECFIMGIQDKKEITKKDFVLRCIEMTSVHNNKS